VGRASWELFYFQLFQKSGDFAWSLLPCHAQLLAVTIRVILLVGFSVEVVLPNSLVQ